MEAIKTVFSLCKVLVSTLLVFNTHCTVKNEKFHISTTQHITGHLILARPTHRKMECAAACLKLPDCRTLAFNKVSGMCQLFTGNSPSRERGDNSVSIYIKSEQKSILQKQNYSKGRLLVSSGRALKEISLDDRAMKSNLPYPWRSINDVAFSEKQQLVFASYRNKLESCKVDTAVCKRLDTSSLAYIEVDDDNELLFLISRNSLIRKISLNGKKYPGFKIRGTLYVRAVPYPKQKILFVAERGGITKFSYKGDFIDNVVSEQVYSIAFDPETASLYYIKSRNNGILRKVLQTREMYGKIFISFDTKPESLLFHKKVLFTSVYNQIYQIDVSDEANVTMVFDTEFGGKVDGKPAKRRKRHGRSSFLSYCYIP